MKYAVFYKKFDELDGDDFDKEVLSQYENLTLKKEGLSYTVNGQEVITTIDDLMQDMCEKQIELIFDDFAERVAKKMYKVLEQKPKEDCISRTDTLEILDAMANIDKDNAKVYSKIYSQIKDAPSVVPKRGKWIKDKKFDTRMKTYVCSNCKYRAWGDREKTPYCPNCGADMRGDEE